MTTFKANLSFLRELLALKEVIDAGQIQGAARRNGIKQSNLSKIISDLESELNTPLLNRSSKGVEPTNTARLLYADIDNIAKSLDKITAAFASAEDLTGYVTVFVDDGFLGNRLLKELSLFYALHLKIRLDLLTDKRLNPSDYDLAVVADVPPSITGKILFKTDSRMHLYASQSYLERRGTPESLSDLLENFDLCMHQSLLNADTNGFVLKKAKHMNTTSDSEVVVFKLVQSGDGVSILHDWLAREVPNLVQLDCGGFEMTRTFFGIANSAVEKTPKIQALMNHLRRLSDSGFIDDFDFF
ncbi:MAG TPA: hypothetical protein DCX19_02375 [Alphaproteobacteria bacterium]|nr:hypothetical protein [Alphaproteobacteria bacterium]